MNTQRMMLVTIAALTPGAVAMTWMFGPGIVINILVAGAAAVIAELIILLLRGLPLTLATDGSALMTGILLGLALPPLLPYWIIIFGTCFAIVFGKHVYGGLGQNLFNPAMVGFAVLILSFPLAMSDWPAPATRQADTPGLETISIKATWSVDRLEYDGLSGATPLDAYKFRGAMTSEEFFDDQGSANSNAWWWINVAFLAGGLLLLGLKVIPWVIPASFLATLSVLSLLFYDAGSSASLGSPYFHLFSGATMMAAFFILTDPVTSPALKQGLIVFAIGVGLITFVIRSFGAYPEGVAFAVLMMNGAAPLIDHILVKQRRT